ncbi:MAG: RNA polymerase subunit sigma [Planctomycetaceae bacterium]|nr:RNA polymerase subunit sigma [Planctomycetaceae bacterium]
MLQDSSQVDDLIHQAAKGDAVALDSLFSRYRPRLKRMVQLRLNQQLRGRVDDSDVLQEAFLEVSKNLDGYLDCPKMPFFLWLRHITGQKLISIHRQHLGAKMRDAGREVSLHYEAPPASTASIAGRILGPMTSPSQAVMKEEFRASLHEALDSMSDLDREVLALRHFEQLTNQEAAQVLQIEESAASKRYLRALERLQSILSQMKLLDD